MVRRLISTYGIDADQITGSGLGGRISRDDVQRYIEANGLKPVNPPPPRRLPQHHHQHRLPLLPRRPPLHPLPQPLRQLLFRLRWPRRRSLRPVPPIR